MKIITVLGSPNLDGNTAAVLGWVEDEINAFGHEFERINLYEKEIFGYLGENSPECKDAHEIMQKIIAADAVIISSPLYCFDVSYKVKALYEQFALFSDMKKFKGKKAALLVTAAGSFENNADKVGPIFSKVINCLYFEEAGQLILTKISRDSLDDEVRKDARDFVVNII